MRDMRKVFQGSIDPVRPKEGGRCLICGTKFVLYNNELSCDCSGGDMVKEMFWTAMAIARDKHNRQFDKCGKPYIEHCIRVSSDVSNYLMEFRCCDNKIEKNMQEEDDYQCVALLHDIIEDTDMTLDELKEKRFNDNVINAIDCITRRKDEKYVDYIDRLCYNDIARLVKIMDLWHNMEVDRGYKAFKEKFGSIFNRYYKAYCKLMDVQNEWERENKRR